MFLSNLKKPKIGMFRKKAFENIVGKGENAWKKNCLFLQCFSRDIFPLFDQQPFYCLENVFNLEWLKIVI